MPKQAGFSKAERLKSRKQIDELFAKGKVVSVFPIRAVYQFIAADEGKLQVGVSVSKRYFKKAVDRNRMKRLMREAYRLQKTEVIAQITASKKVGNVFFIYTDKQLAEFAIIKPAMAKCLNKLIQIIQREDPS